MATISITGTENLATAPAFYVPNRLDEAILRRIDTLLGGARKVAFMTDEILRPEKKMMRYIQAPGRRCLVFNFRKADVRDLREQVMTILMSGYDVLYVPGRPHRNMGCISDIPEPFMRELAALHITPLPLYVGMYRKSRERAYATEAPYDFAEVQVLPKPAPGTHMGERLLQAWMEASAEGYRRHAPTHKSLARMIIEGLRSNPGGQLTDGMDGSKLPYYKVLGVSLALAKRLRSLVKEPRLGILLPPGKGGVIANYACLIAGIVPVNINYTSSESAFRSIVKQSGIRRFITARAFMDKLPSFPWPAEESLLYLDRTLKGIGAGKLAYWVGLARVAPAGLLCLLSGADRQKPEDEAALLFTSGSAGEPKGVSLTNRMLVGHVLQMRSIWYLEQHDNVLASLPIFHSFGLTASTLMPAFFGYGMVTYPSPLEAKKLVELIEREHCALVFSTPTFARSMLRRANPGTFRHVKYFVVGAEKLQKALADEFRSKCGVQLLEGYGLTECSPVVAANLPDPVIDDDMPYYIPSTRAGSVGHVLAGMAVRITDPDDDTRELPLSEQGMIWLKGINVFGGYIGDPELNKGIFRDGWFKTGDLGRVDLNAFITLGGRRARFSKIGGEMVPHEAVEDAITDMLMLPEGFSGRPIAVLGVPDEQKGEALVLLSAVHPTQHAEALAEIRSYLQSRKIPMLWCPRQIIAVEAIPALPSGKLDLKGCRYLVNEALKINI
ncbi:MAG: AMP-binding protein [Akkermansia muciniphila]|nr:AMP-binding protein [Akkermansia muciniphila]